MTSTFFCRRCARCCGPVHCSRSEWRLILAYVRRKKLTPIFRQDPNTCPLLADDNACSVYPLRPTLCRLQGAVPKMPCPNNPEAPLISPGHETAADSKLPHLRDAVLLTNRSNYDGARVPVDDRRKST